MKSLLAGLLVLFLCPVGQVFAQGSVSLAAPAGVQSVDGIIGSLYGLISGPVGQRRDWDSFRALFRQEARLNSMGKDRAGNPRFTSMAIEDYIRNAGPSFEQNGFFERELHRVTETFGDVVHIFSTYESRRTVDSEVFARGINSIQLVRKDGRFWIVNILWNSESADNPIPDKYLH